MLVVLNNFTAISLLGTFNTIARFKKLKDQSIAEYYLLGTLMSIFLGILVI